VLEWEGSLPERDVSWSLAKGHLTPHEAEGTVIYLGKRAALSTAAGPSSPSKPSKYQNVFKNGATIYPRNFYFVRVTDLDGHPDAEHQYWAITDPDQATDSKPPYDKIRLEGFIDGRFLYSSALAKHVVPFATLTPATVALPLKDKDGVLSIVTSQSLKKEGYREFATWIGEAERLWVEKRDQKAARMSLLEWLDYQGKLTAQDLRQQHLVLYNAAGTNVAAACFDRKSCSLPFVVDHKLYWAAFSDPNEADYVAAVLNSDTANKAIKPFQSTGLLGERDIHKKLLELPIPTFDHENEKHQALAKLGKQAREEAVKIVHSGEFPATTTIARQRAFIRVALKDQMKTIDNLVAALLQGKVAGAS
jgi:hypothetical protein